MPSAEEPRKAQYTKRCVSWAKTYRDRLGGILPSKRKTLIISTEDPSYSVLYLGSCSTLQAKGSGCTDAAVSKLWSKSEMGRTGARMLLTAGAQGIRMEPAAEKKAGHLSPGHPRPGHLYLLHRLTHCATDPALPRVLTWVYRHQLKHKAVVLRCHAVLLPKAEQARAAETLLNRTLLTALTEFQRLKRRQDAKRQQQLHTGPGTVPLLPIRKILSGQSCYKPPLHTSTGHSCQKLCSISEDSLGEEEEERSSYLDEESLDEDDDEDEEEMYLIINKLQELDLENEMTSLCGDSMSSQSSGEISDDEASLQTS